MIASLDPPVEPSPDDARSWLRGELLDPEYHDRDLVQRLLTWLARQLDRGLQAASSVPPLSTFAAMLAFVLLGLALAWLLSRARRDTRAPRPEGALLTAEALTAADLRARAEAALGDDHPEQALVDGFRALAVRQVERGRLDDLPGATAHEVADALARSFPHQRPRVDQCARLFDLVRYGERPATADQARSVLALDDELAGVR